MEMNVESSWIPATVMAAFVGAVVSLLVENLRGNTAKDVRTMQTTADHDLLERKLQSDHELALARIKADEATSLGERAWTDYSIRRDLYFEIAEQISGFYEGGDIGDRPRFHRTARRVRLVGSDGVVMALNAFTGAIKTGEIEVATTRMAELFNAMRVDIRNLHKEPPQGTKLSLSDFPIES